MRILSSLQTSETDRMFTVEIANDRYSDIRNYYDESGECWMTYAHDQDDKGSIVYDGAGNTYPDYPINEWEVVDFVESETEALK